MQRKANFQARYRGQALFKFGGMAMTQNLQHSRKEVCNANVRNSEHKG